MYLNWFICNSTAQVRARPSVASALGVETLLSPVRRGTRTRTPTARFKPDYTVRTDLGTDCESALGSSASFNGSIGGDARGSGAVGDSAAPRANASGACAVAANSTGSSNTTDPVCAAPSTPLAARAAAWYKETGELLQVRVYTNFAILCLYFKFYTSTSRTWLFCRARNITTFRILHSPELHLRS